MDPAEERVLRRAQLPLHAAEPGSHRAEPPWHAARPFLQLHPSEAPLGTWPSGSLPGESFWGHPLKSLHFAATWCNLAAVTLL